MRSIPIKITALLALGLLAACQNTQASYPTLANRCLDRPYEAGRCDKQTNFRLFAPGGPIIADQ